MKTCSKCKENKSPELFRKRKTSSDGLDSWCIECCKKARKSHYVRNAEQAKADSLSWYYANKERSEKTRLAYYQKNREAIIARAVAWGRENPERKLLISNRNRRKRRGQPVIKYTYAQWQAKMAYWGNCCWICKGSFTETDHVKPLTKGGWDCLSNMRPVCRSCNVRKGNRWPLTLAELKGIS